MSKRGISQALKRYAAQYERATTQDERDEVKRQIDLQSLKEELDRERKHRKTDKAATDAAALHYDAARETQGLGDRPQDFGFDVSDGEAGAAAVFDAVDDSCFGGNHYTRCRRDALRLAGDKMPDALPTLIAILENEENRQESIWELAKSGNEEPSERWAAAEKKYYRDRKLLLKLFGADAVKVR